MVPWSVADVEAVMGKFSPEERLVVDAGLRDIDQLLIGLATQMNCRVRHDASTAHAGDSWTGLDATLSAPRTIENNDGTMSSGSLDAAVTIERRPEDDGWLVWATVCQNCNRRQCADDPHVLFRAETTTRSPAEAIAEAVAMTSRLVSSVTSLSDRQLSYFVHSQG